MSKNAFTLEQIMGMAQKVGYWNESYFGEPRSYGYSGKVSPRLWSLKEFEINVTKILEESSEQKFSYKVAVSFLGEKVAEFSGPDVSKLFEIAYAKKRPHEAKKYKGIQEVRAALGEPLQDISIVKPLTLEEVLSIIKKMDDCSRYCHSTGEAVTYTYKGRLSIPGAKIIAGKNDLPVDGFTYFTLKYKGEKLFDLLPADSLIEQMDKRFKEIRKEMGTTEMSKHIERMKERIRSKGEKK